MTFHFSILLAIEMRLNIFVLSTGAKESSLGACLVCWV